MINKHFHASVYRNIQFKKKKFVFFPFLFLALFCFLNSQKMYPWTEFKTPLAQYNKQFNKQEKLKIHTHKKKRIIQDWTWTLPFLIRCFIKFVYCLCISNGIKHKMLAIANWNWVFVYIGKKTQTRKPNARLRLRDYTLCVFGQSLLFRYELNGNCIAAENVYVFLFCSNAKKNKVKQITNASQSICVHGNEH